MQFTNLLTVYHTDTHNMLRVTIIKSTCTEVYKYYHSTNNSH